MCSAIPTVLASIPTGWWIVPLIGAVVSSAYFYLLRRPHIKRIESVTRIIGVIVVSLGFFLILDIADPWQLNLIRWQGATLDCQKVNNADFLHAVNLSNQIETFGTLLWVGGLFLFVLAPFITIVYTWVENRFEDENKHTLRA